MDSSVTSVNGILIGLIMKNSTRIKSYSLAYLCCSVDTVPCLEYCYSHLLHAVKRHDLVTCKNFKEFGEYFSDLLCVETSSSRPQIFSNH